MIANEKMHDVAYRRTEARPEPAQEVAHADSVPLLRYLSVCSGIEAAAAAWHPLGWEPAAFAEIAPFPSAVLAHHYPAVPNLGDFTTITAERLRDLGPVHLLVGGTPCQSFSVAGLRKGLADPRGNLALAFLRLADLARPRWLVWENVPGVLSSGGGRDFGAFLGALGQLGYGFAYRVLDAQYFGVPQRRRRVFVVGCLGDWRAAAAVLFERESLSGNPAPSRQAGARVAGTLEGGLGTGGADDNCGHALHLIPARPAAGFRMQAFGQYAEDGTASALKARDFKDATDLIAQNVTGDVSQTLCSRGDSPGGNAHLLPAIAFDWQSGGDVRHNVSADHTSALQACQTPAVALGWEVGPGAGGYTDLAPTLDARCKDGPIRNQLGLAAQVRGAVRRITPREAERLQGFPDDYTAIPWRGKPASECPDGPRYHALGNSMAVPVMAWIGKRIAEVEAVTQEARAAA